MAKPKDDPENVKAQKVGRGGKTGRSVRDYTRRKPGETKVIGAAGRQLREMGRCPQCGHKLDSKNHADLCG